MNAQNQMVGDILNVGSFFLDIAKKLYPDNKDIAGATNVADTLRQTYDVVNTTSIGQNARRTLLSPMVVIQGDLLHQEYMADLITVINIRDIVATLSHFAIRNAEQIESSPRMYMKTDVKMLELRPKIISRNRLSMVLLLKKCTRLPCTARAKVSAATFGATPHSVLQRSLVF